MKHISEPIAEIVDEINKAQQPPGNRKLTDEVVWSAMRLRERDGTSWRMLAEALRVDESTIRRAVERYRAREGAGR